MIFACSHSSAVTGVAWHPSGEYLATSSTDAKCRVFSAHVSTPQQGRSLKEQSLSFRQHLACLGTEELFTLVQLFIYQKGPHFSRWEGSCSYLAMPLFLQGGVTYLQVQDSSRVHPMASLATRCWK